MMHEGDPNTFTRVLYGCEADEVAEVVILTPIDAMIEALKHRSDEVKEYGGFIEGYNADLGGTHVSVFNSRVGSPAASDCAYFLRFTPCRSIIYTGLIGALQSHVRIGDLVVPTAALRGEGSSRYFVEESYPAVADFGLIRAMSSTLDEVYVDCDIGIHYGPIYTTDSFAAETREFLELWQSRNLLGIEMETSVIYIIASLFGMRAAAVHVVSDNPVTKKSFFDPIPDADKKRREECANMLVDSLSELVSRI
jgi:uridine phosphorylase